MKKQVIRFNKRAYDEAIKSLDNAIKTINKYSQELTTNGYMLTIQDIKLIANNNKEFNNNAYIRYLKEICNVFGLDYNKVSTFEYSISNRMFSDMANIKSSYLYSFSNKLHTCFMLHKYLADSKYIDIINNVASKTIQAEELIKELYTSYTNNDKQNIVLELTRQLQDLYSRFNKQGISNNSITRLINNDGSINTNAFYEYTR